MELLDKRGLKRALRGKRSLDALRHSEQRHRPPDLQQPPIKALHKQTVAANYPSIQRRN